MRQWSMAIGTLWVLSAGAILLALLGGWLLHSPTLSFIARLPDSSQRDIFLLDARTNVAVNVTNSRYDEWSFQWAGDGRLLYSATVQPGRGDELLLRRYSQTQSLQNEGSLAFNPRWSPDGTRLVFVSSYPRNVSDVFLADATTLSSRRLTNTPTISETQPAWSPDSTRLVYVANSNLWLHAIDDAVAPQRITRTPDDDSVPVWSPDGTQLAFYRTRYQRQMLYVYDLAAGTETRLLTSQTHDLRPQDPISWSPDSTQLVLPTGNGAVTLIDADDGELHRIDVPVTRHHSAVWSPRQNVIAFVAADTQTAHVLDVKRGTVQALQQSVRVLPPLVWR